MDYKITELAKQVQTKEAPIADFPELLFGITPDETAVFDATEYCIRAENNKTFNSRLFMRAYKPFIESFITVSGMDANKLFYRNPDGHELVHEELVFLFLAFTNKNWVVYFNNIISDAITNGIAFSDSFVLQLAIGRVPTDILEKIIQSRKQNGQQSTT